MSDLATLIGWFGYYRFGATYPPPDPNLPANTDQLAVNITSVGYIHFDGAGNTYSSQQTSRNGVFDSPPPDFPTPLVKGKYSVDGITFVLWTLDSPPVSLSQGVIVGDGDEFFAQATAQGKAVLFIGKRIPSNVSAGFVASKLVDAKPPRPGF